MVTALNRNVVRDLWRLRGQLVPIILVMACGVGIYIAMRSTMRSLESARSKYYAEERFADMFVGVKRAPASLARRIETIDGVQSVETRVVVDVTLDVPGMIEAATGRIVSLPDRGRPAVNDVRLRSGRLPRRGNEVLVNEAFAKAHVLPLGARIGALIDGRYDDLEIVGTALSPEFIYAVAPGLMFPDDKRFGVFWMRRRAIAPAFDMTGAFNDVVLRVARGASLHDIELQVEDLVAPFGGAGVLWRENQVSAFFVANELVQLQSFATMIPALFLFVGVFLLNIVVGRVVSSQREIIAGLKAFGYRDREIGWYFAKLVGAVVAIGCILGVGIGVATGRAMTEIYERHFRFPELPFKLGSAETLEAAALVGIAAALGTAFAIRRAVTLLPAEGMRPEAPPVYRPTVLERMGLSRLFPVAAHSVLREIERKPRRSALTIAGVVMATGLTVMNTFSFDSIRHLLHVHFGLAQRETVQVSLHEPRGTALLSELEHLPGVQYGEPFRVVPVRFRAGSRVKSGSIVGMAQGTTLMALHDRQLARIALPVRGLVIAEKLAELLSVGVGDSLRVEILEGRRAVRTVEIARVVDTMMGTPAHMELASLCRMLQETPSMNGAWLHVDEAKLPQLHEAAKRKPVVTGVIERRATLRSARTTIDSYLGSWLVVGLLFSLVMSFGVLYNAVRITLAERSRELASLRVLGFRHREVGIILVGEMIVLICIALPIGLAFGYALAYAMATGPGFDTEQFRLPLVVSPSTYATATLAVVASAVVSGWRAWRMLERVDLVEVLKSHD